MSNQFDTTARKAVFYHAFTNKDDEFENIQCGHGTHISGILIDNSYSKKAASLGITYDTKIVLMDIGKQAASCAGQTSCEETLEIQGSRSAHELTGESRRAHLLVLLRHGGNEYNTQSRDLDS